MLLEYKAIIVLIHSWAIWGAILLGFLLVRDANIRWCLVFFAVIQGVVLLALPFSRLIGHPIFYHLWHVFFLSLFLRAVIFRPYLCARLGQYWVKLPYHLNLVMEWCLPSKSVWVIYPAELGLQRIYKGYVCCHLLALFNYGLAYLGITSRDGWLASNGFNRLIVWDLAYAANAVLILLEIVLFTFLVIRGLKTNFSLKL